MRRLVIIVLLMLVVPCLALAQTLTPAQAAAEQGIREADAALAKVVAAKNVDACVAFFDAEAALPSAEGTVYRAKDAKAFRAVWEQLFSIPGFDLTWTTEQFVVTNSGMVGYSNGTWDNGLVKGRFFTVWRKQPDGKWKLLVDAPWEVPAEKK